MGTRAGFEYGWDVPIMEEKLGMEQCKMSLSLENFMNRITLMSKSHCKSQTIGGNLKEECTGDETMRCKIYINYHCSNLY